MPCNSLKQSHEYEVPIKIKNAFKYSSLWSAVSPPGLWLDCSPCSDHAVTTESLLLCWGV